MSVTSLQPRFFGSGAETLHAFYSGDIDLAYMGMAPFALAHATRIPLSVVAVVNVSKGGEGIVLASRADPAKLSSMTIATAHGSTAHQLLATFCSQIPEAERPSTLFLSPSFQITALLSGFIDGVSLWDPFKTFLCEEHGCQLVHDDADRSSHTLNLLVASERFLRRYPGTLFRFISCQSATTRWMSENPKRAQELLARLLSTPEASAFQFSPSTVQSHDWTLSWEDSELNQVAFPAQLARALAFQEATGSCRLPEVGVPDPACRSGLHPNAQDSAECRSLRIGYSADVMCGAFLLAGAQRRWRNYDFALAPHHKLVSERLVHYDDSFEAVLRSLHHISATESPHAVVSLRAIIEANLRVLAERLNLAQERKGGLFYYLELLQKADAIPASVKDYSHLIRLLGNAAAHGTANHAADLPLLIELTMRILDWVHDEHAVNCPSCAVAVRGEWDFCARCGEKVFLD